MKTIAFPRDRTVRHPTSSGPDNPDRLNSVLNELRMDSNRIAVTMVTNSLYGSYDIFSTNRVGQQTLPRPPSSAPVAERIAWGSSGSLEAIHGLYHVLIGGWGNTPSGHMSQVPCAAFDPIFWAHHGNIERLFTVWQAVHPNSWFSNSTQAGSALLPFLKPKTVGNTEDRFWTSNSARNAADFGYSFPDLVQSNTSIADRFRGLYSWSIPRVPGGPKQAPPDNMKPIDVSSSEFFKPPSTAPPVKLLGLRDTHSLPPRLASHIRKVQVPMNIKIDKNIAWDWFVDDHVERLALNTSFTISYFILSDPTTTVPATADLPLEPSLVGATHIFASPAESCASCASQATSGVLVRNTVPITSQLHDYIAIAQLPSMLPDDVLGFLRARLRWRILKSDGMYVDPRTIPSLEIRVSAKRTVLDDQGDPTDQVEHHEYPEVVGEIIANASAEAGHMG